MLVSAVAFAQKVSGTIRDSKGEPVIGAVVMVAGSTTVACMTDVDGKYTLDIPKGNNISLVATCIGFKSSTQDVGGRAVVDFILEEDNLLLEEVVVVGYGSMRKSDLTGSVASVKIDEDEAGRSSSLDQMLQGRASGVQVLSNNASPDAGVSIRVRGLGTFEGGSEPLYVVDGVIINGASSSVNQMSAGGTENSSNEEINGLMGINPQDVANIEILKDASATAIYGSLGANGVVLITTKMAGKEKPTVNFNAGVSVSTVSNHIPMLTFDEYCDYLAARGRSLSAIYENPETRTGLKVQPVDWQDYTLRPAVSQRYYLSVSGRPKTLSYMMSLGYNDNQGIVKNSGSKQLTLRLNLDKSIGKKLKIGTKTGLGFIKSDLTSSANANVSGSASSLTRSLLLYRPYMTLDKKEDDQIYSEEEEASSGPDRWLKNFTNTREEFRVTPSLYVDWKILKWMSFKSTVGADYRNTEIQKFKANKISRQNGSFASVNETERLRYNWDNVLSFNHKFVGAHTLNAILGASISRSRTISNMSEAWRIQQDRAGFASINSGVAPYTNLQHDVTEYSLASFIARAVYNYKDRYVVTATYRLDGSSRFQGSNKWASFPSFAFAWRVSSEPWFNVDFIEMAKVRLGWGQVGNQAIPSYRTMPNYAGGVIGDHTPGNASMTQVAIYNSNIANKNLRWETTQQLNAGIDIGFFKGRLTFSMDLYDKQTKDLLQSKNIALSSGFSTMYVNQGNVLNRGIELTLDSVPVRVGDFEWSLGGNISFNKGRITYIGEGIEKKDIYLTPDNMQTCNFFWGETVRSSTSNIAVLNIFIEGQPMGLFYGFKTLGIVQEGEDWPGVASSGGKAKPGDVKYMDINKNGIIDDDDRTVIGDPNPVFTYGFNTSLSWKGLTLTASFNGTFGNKIYNANNFTEYNTSKSGSRPYNVRREAFVEAWSPNHTDTVFPRLEYSDDFISDRYVDDGSYLRLANLSIRYDFRFKKKKLFIKGLGAGLSAGNLFVVTKYGGWDPEVNSFGSNIKRMGVDMGSYPNSRSFSLDLKFTF